MSIKSNPLVKRHRILLIDLVDTILLHENKLPINPNRNKRMKYIEDGIKKGPARRLVTIAQCYGLHAFFQKIPGHRRLRYNVVIKFFDDEQISISDASLAELMIKSLRRKP